MKTVDIIRAWKDVSYRRSLTAAELASVPANPAGHIELGDAELSNVGGGRPIVSKNTCTVDNTWCCATGPVGCPSPY